MNVQVTEDRYELRFDYEPFLVDFCKNLQGARYNPHQKFWSAARNVPNALDLKRYDIFDDIELLKKINNQLLEQVERGNFIWNINASLYEHQKAFANWAKTHAKALLCAEMGCGKTLMSMLWLQVHGIDPSSVIVVCPASLINNWARELEKFTGIKAIPVSGSPSSRREALSQSGLHLVNYEYLPQGRALRSDVAELKKSCVILDESHKLKDPTTGRSKVLHGYCKDKTHLLLLTGTPVSQGAQDYYSQFKCIEPRLLGTSFTAFKSRYCQQEAVRGAHPGVKRIVGFRNLNELTDLIKPYTYNILKKDCLDLPPKQYITHFVELSQEQRQFYNKLKSEFAAWLDGHGEGEPVLAPNILTRYLRLSQVTQGHINLPDGTLYQFADNPKLDMLIDLVNSFHPGESAVIVCRFKQDIKILKDHFGNDCVVIDGDVPITGRQDVVDTFQAGHARFLIGQIQTMGVGFNMTRANKMIFFSNSYSLTDRLQAEDRIHRIGTTGDHCTYIDIVAMDTVDMHVVQALTDKQDVAQYLTRLRLT